MPNSKVQLADGTVLIDLTSDTVTSETLMEGVTAHDKAGNLIVGTARSGGTMFAKENITVLTSAFSTYTPSGDAEGNLYDLGYIYKGQVSISGVDEDMIPSMTFDTDSLRDADVDLANQFQTYNGGVYIYSDMIPVSSITILTAEFREVEFI